MVDAEKILRNTLDKELDEHGYIPRDVKIDPISSGGANYTSKLFLVDVTTPKEQLKLFAKVAIINKELRQTMCADWLFKTERIVFTKIAKVFDRLQTRYNIPEDEKLRFPKFYGCSDEQGKEVVLMENLMASGYQSFDRFKSMDWEHACASVEYLAKFHALSFAYAKDYPEEFEELANMKYEIGAQELDEEVMKPMMEKIIGGALAVVKEDQRDRLMKYFNTMPKMNAYTISDGRPVLSHGDFRLSNILFRKSEDKLSAIAVDFQTVYAGRPPTDLIYLIFLGSDVEFRAEYYEKLIAFYYDSLCAMMRKYSLEPTEVYPKENFDSDMKETLPYAVLLGTAVLPTVLVEENTAPDPEKQSFDQFIRSPTEIYAKRFSGIVDDCIRWNVI
ncbi:unnamed protein product [Leptosia nina]|uniref:CHK kinase-like domain-containing protein n=1 Tax=Leptosia nina TaxID=320188 RepID=A0AAV1JM33_9NEOP